MMLGFRMSHTRYLAPKRWLAVAKSAVLLLLLPLLLLLLHRVRMLEMFEAGI